jgi:A/G-specific adenine glycosylase
MDAVSLRRDLLRWYRREARDLPWRRTRDPYAIWVSEVMLQQTRVDVAAPYFLRWMARFPTVQALAAADPEDVLRLWSGLGYYSRARKLHEAGRTVAAHGFPTTASAWQELPGIGPYTAGAIASIAQGERVPAVDGNVVRVLARLNAWQGAAADPELLAKVNAEAANLVPGKSPGDWNQAVMDLGATVCTPRNPACGDCPVARHCAARIAGMQASIPAPKRQAVAKVERRAFAVVRKGSGVLLVRNPAKGLLAGLWSLPGGPATTPLAELVLEQAGARVRMRGAPAVARHLFSHRTWEMAIDLADLVEEKAAAPGRETAWVADADLAGHALPTAMRTALAAAGVGKPKRRKGSGRA